MALVNTHSTPSVWEVPRKQLGSPHTDLTSFSALASREISRRGMHIVDVLDDSPVSTGLMFGLCSVSGSCGLHTYIASGPT